jgi:hypothetical protein
MTATAAPTTTAARTTADVSHRTALTTGAVAGAVAAALNLALSAFARGPLDASDDFMPLTPGPIVMWTIVGALVAAVAWRRIVSTSPRSRALLRRLVPAVLVLSFVPDVALLATDGMTGQTTPAVVSLMVMHAVTAVVVVAAYRRAMPPR